MAAPIAVAGGITLKNVNARVLLYMYETGSHEPL